MRIILTIVFVIIGSVLVAQNDSTATQGEIISGEVVIEKNNEIILPNAEKIYVRGNPRNFSNEPVEISFQLNEPRFEWPDYKSDVPFKSLKEPYPLATYQNYVRLGYGNFNSPLFEAGLFKTFGTFDTQTKLFYESFKSGPVNGENSGNAMGGIDFSGAYRKETFSLTPTLSYKIDNISFYGNANRVNSGFDQNNPTDLSIGDFLLDLELAGVVKDNEVSYSLKPSVSTVTQNFDRGSFIGQETVIGALGSLNYKIDDTFTTGFEVNANKATYDAGQKLDRSLININPWVTHKRDALSITAGFMLSSGKVAGNSDTGFFPRARVDYQLTDKWSLYGLVSGGQEWNSLSQLLNENQFLDDSLQIVSSKYLVQFGGGLKGSPVKNLLLEANMLYSSVEGLPFFIPSASDSSRYILAYDTESVGVVTFSSNLSYMPTATSTYGVSLELNTYSLESLDRPWHKPAYILKAYTSHNIQEKLIVSAYFTSMGGIRGPANVDFGIVKLPNFVDLGLSANYLITSRASAFILVNNLLNDEYERYLGYPTRGITFKLGGQYRF